MRNAKVNMMTDMRLHTCGTFCIDLPAPVLLLSEELFLSCSVAQHGARQF